MATTVSEATTQAILQDILDPTKSFKDIARTYKDVCNTATIRSIGDKYQVDWDLRDQLADALIQRAQHNAAIVEMESKFFNSVKQDRRDDEEDGPYIRYGRSYRRVRR